MSNTHTKEFIWKLREGEMPPTKCLYNPLEVSSSPINRILRRYRRYGRVNPIKKSLGDGAAKGRIRLKRF
jgi:hypothetical protein